MLTRQITKKFKTDFKKIKHNIWLVNELEKVLIFLEEWKVLPIKNRDHELQGKYKWLRECHIKPDLLLIYKKENNNLTLFLLRLWNHNELF
jgi:mRNA interferase YafQ